MVAKAGAAETFIWKNAAFRGLPAMIEHNKISPSDMTPEARRREVADLIAQGLVRLRRGDSPTGGEISESVLGLGFVPDQRVHANPTLNEEV